MDATLPTVSLPAMPPAAPESVEPAAARVLVVFGNIPLLGQERGNIQVFNVLAERGVEPLFLTHRGYGHESIQPELDRLGHAWVPATYPGLFSRGMSAGDWGAQLRKLWAGSRDLWTAARAFHPTHIHVGNVTHFLAMLPALWALRVPVIYRVGDAPQQHSAAYRAIWRYLIVPRVSRFVCISNYVRDLVLEAGAAPEQVRVIYNYPPERATPVAPTAPDEDYAGRTVAYMGQLSEEKGVGLLVESAVRLCEERDDVRFLLAGDYTWQNPFAEGLIDRVARLGLTGRIQFLGYVDDIPGLLSRADLHVCPSLCPEALSNVVPEAKQAGVPSVVFASGGLPELIEHGADGWVCTQRTASGLRAGMDYFLEMSDERLAAARAAARASMEALGITRRAFADSWVQVYA